MILIAGNPAHLLASIDFFDNLTLEELDEIALSGVERTYIKDTYLFHQGDSANRFYVLLEGKIKLTQLTEEGGQVILRYVSPGEAFAIIAVLRKISYPVTAMAVEKAVVLSWDEQTVLTLMMQYPQMAINSLGILAARIQEFQDRFREIATERVERRIARSILRLASQTGRKTQDGILIDLSLTRQDLAEMTGTTLYTVSRILSQWEKAGLVQSKREQVTILAPHRLVVIAEEMGKE
jgi:CRP-like cAMP-binding protein